MVALPSDLITLPLLPRVIPRSSSPIITRHRHDGGSLNNTQKIVVVVVASVLVLILVIVIVISAWQRKKRAARTAPKDAMKSLSSSSSSSSFAGFPEAPPGPPPGGPRALDNHLSPGENMMHDVPLSAGPKYGYGAQVDGLRIPSMTAKPGQVQYGYNQVMVSHFSDT